MGSSLRGVLRLNGSGTVAYVTFPGMLWHIQEGFFFSAKGGCCL